MLPVCFGCLGYLLELYPTDFRDEASWIGHLVAVINHRVSPDFDAQVVESLEMASTLRRFDRQWVAEMKKEALFVRLLHSAYEAGFDQEKILVVRLGEKPNETVLVRAARDSFPIIECHLRHKLPSQI